MNPQDRVHRGVDHDGVGVGPGPSALSRSGTLTPGTPRFERIETYKQPDDDLRVLEHLPGDRGFHVCRALGEREAAEQAGVRSGGNDLDRDVRQASDAREVGELAFGNACDANV